MYDVVLLCCGVVMLWCFDVVMWRSCGDLVELFLSLSLRSWDVVTYCDVVVPGLCSDVVTL